MGCLSHLRLRTKLLLMLGLAAVAVIISVGAAGALMQHRMRDDRMDKLRAVVQSAISITQSLENRVAAHQLTREQALGLLRVDIHALRFDDRIGYIYVQTSDSMILAQETNPAMEGKPVPLTVLDSSGRPLNDTVRESLAHATEGSLSYSFPKPEQTGPEPKLSNFARFTPWDLAFIAGAYVDDIDAAFRALLLRLSLIGSAVILVTMLLAWFINRDVTQSLGRLRAAMDRLAKGDLATAVGDTDRRDEVGEMAAAVQVFKTT
jgi:methyl-accepting chemotaxis protein